ncbi:helix-turn-helix domain-containing protein [Kangiella spongicola]|jgi:transcriptional regulator with XRE-family HTH domain|uniref:XRE family transcriptional regulator n=1 Tax=Kangiella spongicola TaxID=796379 RepID=A0A318D2L1_9GAMM|nr:helix-turn-helix transcriptional regulator [Kangiella spongicola]MBV35089.1 transcriptional regulator [Rickettsiales bacterium]PXF63053.1 XRE family transcriptional regulator [Kangiella spongicola]
MSEIINQLKQLMNNFGETDYSMQRKSNISQSTIYRILERKTTDPGVHKIDTLARALGFRLSLVPIHEADNQIDYTSEVDTLKRIITLVESLANARGIELTPEEKAEMILSNYQANSSKEELGMRIVNLK